MTITKKTLMLLKQYGNCTKSNYNYRVSLITDVLLSTEVICGNYKEGFELCNINDIIDRHIGAHITSDYARKSFIGMQSRYPTYVSTTMTHGNDWVELININKLVASILSET